MSCKEKHGNQCKRCTSGREVDGTDIKKECTECIGNFVLDSGKCVSCDQQEGCLNCNQEGCTKCKPGMFLDRENAKRPWSCFKCSEKLSNCDLCKSKERCDRCTHEYFKLGKDGQCRCNGGSRAVVNQVTGKCSCKRGYFLTDQGCVTCQEAIGDCR